jgi:hypothetical protein
MDEYSDTDISAELASQLGLAGAVAASDSASFVDFSPIRTPSIRNVQAGMENARTLKHAEPRIVLRKNIEDEIADGAVGLNDFQYDYLKAASATSWRNAIEKKYFYTKYTVTDNLYGNISFINLSNELYWAKDNNFFRPFNLPKLKLSSSNIFYTARFRFPKAASNTYNLTIQTNNGELTVRPRGLYVSGEMQPTFSRSTYYRWHENLTKFPSGKYPELSAIGGRKSVEIKYSGSNGGITSGGLLITGGTLEGFKLVANDKTVLWEQSGKYFPNFAGYTLPVPTGVNGAMVQTYIPPIKVEIPSDVYKIDFYVTENSNGFPVSPGPNYGQWTGLNKTAGSAWQYNLKFSDGNVYSGINLTGFKYSPAAENVYWTPTGQTGVTAKVLTKDIPTFSSFYIPYPTTLDRQEFPAHNIETCISSKLNSDPLQVYGLLAISIGSARQKQIVYVSPHSYATGFFNTPEKFTYTENDNIKLDRSSIYKKLSVTGAGFQSINTRYKESINRSINGNPEFLALDYYNTGNPGHFYRKIYWDGASWIISASGTSIYTSESKINVNSSIPASYGSADFVEGSKGLYTEITGINFEKMGRAWEKVSNYRVNVPYSDFFKLKNLIYWDPVGGSGGISLQTIPTPTNIVYVSAPRVNKVFNLQKYDGSTTGQYYYPFSGQPGVTRGSSIRNISPIFFNQISTTSGILNFRNTISADPILTSGAGAVLRSGTFIGTTGARITGQFWSGSGFTYATGSFYNETGGQFFAQVVSGSGVQAIISEQRILFWSPLANINMSSLFPLVSGRMPETMYGEKTVGPFIGPSGAITRITGRILVDDDLYINGQRYTQDTSFNFADNVNVDILTNQQPITIDVWNYNGNAGATGTLNVVYAVTGFVSRMLSGQYEKHATNVFQDTGSNNKLLYDISGDYGHKDKWLLINETNSKISGINSGYDILFVNKYISYPLILPRIIGWEPTGQVISGKLQINNIQRPITGVYRLAPFIYNPSGFGDPIANEDIDSMSYDNPRLYVARQEEDGTGLRPTFFRTFIQDAYARGGIIYRINNTGQITTPDSMFNIPQYPGGLISSGLSIISGNWNFLANFSRIPASQYPLNVTLISSGEKSPELVQKWNKTVYSQQYQMLPTVKQSNFKEKSKQYSVTQQNQVKGIALDSYYLSGGYVIPNGTISEEDGAQYLAPIKQETPLKDTLFYRFYNHLYSADKTLATGTWDGVIPSGSSVTVEIMSTFFDEYFGLSDNLGMFYSGQDDALNTKIQQTFNNETITGAVPKLYIDSDDRISYTAYAVNENFHDSKMHAKKIARKKLQQRLTLAAKREVPEIIFKNTKFIRMEGFKQRQIDDFYKEEGPFNIFTAPTGNILVKYKKQ